MPATTPAGPASVHMVLEIEPDEFARVRDDFIADLAEILDIEAHEIEILRIERGCTDLELLIPLNKRELFELIKKRDADLPERLLVEIANFVRKYRIMTMPDRPPSVISSSKTSRQVPEQSLTWLHISDVHFETADSGTRRNYWAQDKVKETFIRDLPELLREEHLEPDIVFLTGDVAFSGDRKEYDIAVKFLDELRQRLPKPNVPIMLIPGNHDVCRSVAERYSREEKDAQTFLASNQAIIEYMHSPKHADDRTRVFRRLDNFRAFTKRCKRFGQPLLDGHCAFSSVQSINGVGVGIAGMNSAWRCSSDADRGRVVLGVPQIDEAVKQLQDAHLRVALVHHPPETDWYVLDDMRYQREAFPNFDFVLRGHEHDPRVQLSFFAGREYCHISAGALYSTDAYQKSFNVVQLDLETQSAWVFFWKLTSGTLKWVKDVELYHNGYQFFQLPEKLASRLTEAVGGRG